MDHVFDNMWQIMRRYNLDINDDISSDLRCTICNRILIDAHSTHCGCRFCIKCLQDYLTNGNQVCPGNSEYCKLEMINMESNVNKDRPMDIKISKVKANCPNIGCQSRIELRMISDHLEICDKSAACSHLELRCEEHDIINDQNREHILEDICSRTKSLLKWRDTSLHESESVKRDIEKLREDNATIREELRSEKERTGKIVRELFKRDKKNRTEIEILYEEISFLKNQNRSMKEELSIVKNEQANRQAIEDQKQEIEQLRLRVQATESDFIRESGKSNDFQVTLNEILQTVAALKAGSTDSIRLDSVDRIAEMPESSDVDDLGEFIWAIDNWAEKVVESQNNTNAEIFSDVFYSHVQGYKMCLAVDPFQNYLRLYFYIMKGPYDDFLDWPFTCDVELSLLNQSTGRIHKSKTVRCSLQHSDPDYLAFQKPINDRNVVPGGFTYFMKLDKLMNNPELCKDNQVVIKCLVKSDL